MLVQSLHHLIFIFFFTAKVQIDKTLGRKIYKRKDIIIVTFYNLATSIWRSVVFSQQITAVYVESVISAEFTVGQIGGQKKTPHNQQKEKRSIQEKRHKMDKQKLLYVKEWPEMDNISPFHMRDTCVYFVLCTHTKKEKLGNLKVYSVYWLESKKKYNLFFLLLLCWCLVFIV